MSITLDQLVFDPSNPDDGANVGAYLRGADGTVIGNNSDALKVALDAASLAALEDINVTVSNEVEISNDAGNPVPVNATDLDIRDLSFATDSVDVSGSSVNFQAKQSGQNTAATVTNAASQIDATALANRKAITIQNLGKKDIFIGFSAGVTSSNGTKIPRGASAEFDWSDNIDVYAITDSGTADVRLLETA